VDTLSVVIARNARAIRAEQQQRQVDVAKRGGISRTRLSLIESGDRRITAEDILALCVGLGVVLGDLVRGVDAPTRRALGL
jgi:transcriptional regulator with XRE-family HTH domain